MPPMCIGELVVILAPSTIGLKYQSMMKLVLRSQIVAAIPECIYSLTGRALINTFVCTDERLFVSVRSFVLLSLECINHFGFFYPRVGLVFRAPTIICIMIMTLIPINMY